MQEIKKIRNKILTYQPSKKKLKHKKILPPIPSKRYFTIGETARLCALEPHVLRYWEQEFQALNPQKRRGNRRYYQQKDIAMVRQIRTLLYDKGFTIEGARTQLLHPSTIENKNENKQSFTIVKKMIADLEDILQKLRA